MRRAVWATAVVLVAAATVARAEDEATANGWRLTGDRGETVKVLPSPHRVPSAAGHPVEAPVTGMTVYPASYGSGNLIDHRGLEIAHQEPPGPVHPHQHVAEDQLAVAGDADSHERLVANAIAEGVVGRVRVDDVMDKKLPVGERDDFGELEEHCRSFSSVDEFHL